MQKLFAIEAIADEKKLTLKERSILRETQSKSVLEEFYHWITEISLKTLPQSLLVVEVLFSMRA